MLVIDTDETLPEHLLEAITQELTEAKCDAVLLPVFTNFLNRPALAAKLEANGIKVIAARGFGDTLYCATNTKELAALFEEKPDPAQVGTLSLVRDDGTYRLPDGSHIPSWRPGDPVTEAAEPPLQVFQNAFSWTNAYPKLHPFTNDELLSLRNQIRFDAYSKEEQADLHREFQQLQRNHVQMRIVADANRIVEALREHDYKYGIGRGSAMASKLCYRLRITRKPPPPYLVPLRFYDNLHRTPDVDINVSSRNRPEIMTMLSERFGASRLGVVNKHGQIAVHPSAVSLQPLAIARDNKLPLTGDDAKALALPVVDVLASRVVDQITDVLANCPKPDPENKQVWAMIATGATYGLPEIGTPLGQRLSRSFRPQSLADLERLMALLRPGALAASKATPQNWRSVPLFQEDALFELWQSGMSIMDAYATVTAVSKSTAVPSSVHVPESATETFDRIANSGFLFSRAHAHAYAVQTLTLAVRRNQYPAEYMDAVMPYVDDKQLFIEHVAHGNQLSTVFPTINASEIESHVVDNELHVGLCAYFNPEQARAVVRSRFIVPFANDPKDFKRRMGYDPPCTIGC